MLYSGFKNDILINRGRVMITIVTNKTIYFYNKKGIRFYFRVLTCILRHVEYEVVEY